MTEAKGPSCPRGLSIFVTIINEMGNGATHSIADASSRGERGSDRSRRRSPLGYWRRSRRTLARGVRVAGVRGSGRAALVLTSHVGGR
jgi:hypothetical protein